jgi:hypothetical protein
MSFIEPLALQLAENRIAVHASRPGYGLTALVEKKTPDFHQTIRNHRGKGQAGCATVATANSVTMEQNATGVAVFLRTDPASSFTVRTFSVDGVGLHTDNKLIEIVTIFNSHKISK